MMAASFNNTHSFSMNQRAVVLKVTSVVQLSLFMATVANSAESENIFSIYSPKVMPEKSN